VKNSYIFLHIRLCRCCSSKEKIIYDENGDMAFTHAKLNLRAQNTAPPVWSVNGRVVFFCKERQKNLHPQAIDSPNFCRAITPPTTGNRNFVSAPLPSAPLYGKIGYTTAQLAFSLLCGGSAPAPPTSSKEQK